MHLRGQSTPVKMWLEEVHANRQTVDYQLCLHPGSTGVFHARSSLACQTSGDIRTGLGLWGGFRGFETNGCTTATCHNTPVASRRGEPKEPDTKKKAVSVSRVRLQHAEHNMCFAAPLSLFPTTSEYRLQDIIFSLVYQVDLPGAKMP